GNSSHLAEEVNLAVCRARNIPVLRRASGGATIVTGPGCLMYAVVLAYRGRWHLRDISEAHRFVLEKIAAALQAAGCKPQAESGQQAARSLLRAIGRAGISDLPLAEPPSLKFSGNSLRCKRNHFLYHGTLLYNFPIDEITGLLKMPSRQPAYRQARGHGDFLTNLPLERGILRQALTEAFGVTDPRIDWPRELTAKLT